MDTGIRGKWRNLRSLIHVEMQTTQLDSDEVRREVRYYISSLDEPASAFQSHIRQHWSIENSCHRVLDTAFREDHNQTYIAHAFAVSNSLPLWSQQLWSLSGPISSKSFLACFLSPAR